jgi:quercetin dioxygenase-like cupin family protein
MEKAERTFVRGVYSESYGLDHIRQAQLAAPRVRDESVVVDDGSVGHSGTAEERASSKGRGWWRIGPGDDQFLTQTLQIHFVELAPRSRANGHGHQNEACFYILDGRGFEMHDGIRYDWKQDDLVFVHPDSFHQHNNPYDESALCLVMKAKSTWMFMGLIQQGRPGPIDRPDEFGEREEWGRIWTPGSVDRKKVVSVEDTTWENTPLGRVRTVNSIAQNNHRQWSVDVYELDIPAAGRSGKYWKMADEVMYIKSGSGYSLHWEVQAEIAEKYYARIALEPKRYDFNKGDTLYIPQNTIAQHFASDGTPLRMISSQNRLFKHLGYDAVHYFEPASA